MEITFRHVDKTPRLERLIARGVKRLERFAGDLIGCRICVERPHAHEQSGNPVTVRLEATMPPHRRLVVTRGGGDSDMHRSLNQVIHEAFRTMERRLSDSLAGTRAKGRGSRNTPEMTATAS